MANETSLGGISWYVDADTSKAVQSVSAFDALVDKATVTLKKLGASISKMAASVKKAMIGVSRSIGQAGIQVQQFVGQIQGGQSAMLALSQQAADLGFVLGAPMVGAVVGIGASLLGLAMNVMTTENAMKTFIETLGELDDNDLANLTGQKQQTAVSEFTQQLSEQEAELKRLQSAQASIELSQATLTAKIQEGGRVQEETVNGFRGSVTVVRNYGEQLDNTTTALKRNLIEQQNQNELIEQTKTKLKLANDELNIYQGQIDKTIANANLMARAHGKNGVELAKLNKEIALKSLAEKGATKEEIKALSSAHDMIIASEARQQKVRDEAKALREKTLADQKAARAQRITDQNAEKRRKAAEQDQANANKMLQLRNQYLADARTDDQAGADTMMTLRTEYIDEGRGEAQDIVGSDSEEAARQAQIEKLQSLRELDIENEQLYQDAITKLQEEGAAARQQAISTSMGTLSSAFGSMAQTISDAGNESSDAYKALFAVSKAFAIAQAGLNLSLAVSQAMAAAPWPANLAAMAQVAASGAALVSSISSATYAGREHGGSVQAGQTYEVGEKNKPEMLMIPGNNGKVFSNAEMKSMMGGGGSGSSAPVIHNYAARDGYQVEYQRGGMGQQDVIKIVTSEMKNRSSKSRQALGRTSNTTNKVGSRR